MWKKAKEELMNKYIVNMENEVNTLPKWEEIIKFLSTDQPLVLYGAGEVGYAMAKILTFMEFNIAGFVVSDVFGQSNPKDRIPPYAICDSVMDIPVYPLSKLPFESHQCHILITMQVSSAVQAYQALQNKGYKNIFMYDFIYNESTDTCNPLYKALKRIMLKTRLGKYHISLKEEFIDLNHYKILNPFKQDASYLDDFSSEVNDLLFPSLLDDYSMVDEGPYKYEELYKPLININAYCLSDVCGQVTMKLNSVLNGGNSFMLQAPHHETVTVETTTIDTFVQENNITKIDFIKVDIEGAERLMLKGAKKTLQTLKPKLAICTYHFKDDPMVLEAIIKEANPNYIVNHRWKKLYAYVPN